MITNSPGMINQNRGSAAIILPDKSEWCWCR